MPCVYVLRSLDGRPLKNLLLAKNHVLPTYGHFYGLFSKTGKIKGMEDQRKNSVRENSSGKNVRENIFVTKQLFRKNGKLIFCLNKKAKKAF